MAIGDEELVMIRKALLGVGVLLMLASCAPVASTVVSPGFDTQAADYYVSPVGNDGAAGTSAAPCAPWLRVHAAAGRQHAGGAGRRLRRTRFVEAGGRDRDFSYHCARRPVNDPCCMVSCGSAPFVLDDQRLERHLGDRELVIGGDGPFVRRHRLGVRERRALGAHSVAGLEVNESGLNTVPPLGDWTLSGLCVHDTYPSNGTNQDHNVYVADMSQYSPMRVA